MKIMYKGSLPNGSIQWKGMTYNFKKGEPIEVPKEVGEAYCAGANWKEVEKTESRKSNKRG